MARTILSSSRLAETRDPNLGKIIICCEGDTEKYYFDYFVEIIEKEKKAGKYTDIHIETESANGNARRVFKYANEYLSNDDNSRRFGLYAKYLTFDCDAPQDIQNVIMDARDHGGYVLLLTNHLFETWLLMHFEDVNDKITKASTYAHLSSHLHTKYQKSRKGLIREILANGSVERAIENAACLDKKYASDGLSIYANIKEMNPYSTVYALVERFMIAISR